MEILHTRKSVQKFRPFGVLYGIWQTGCIEFPPADVETFQIAD